MLFIIVFTLISAYLSLVIGTAKKFKINGIHFSPFTRLLILFLPAMIFAIHFKMAAEKFGENKHLAFEIIKMGTVKYPVALGILIEVSLEKFAQRAVFGQSLTHVKKQPINVDAGTINRQRSSVFDIYERTTVDLAAC